MGELKWQPMEKYNTKEYDWVLVQFIDSRDNFVYIPMVVEKRADGGWYNLCDEMINPELIPVCFFDMQGIPGLEEFVNE